MSSSVEEIFSTEAGHGPLVLLLHGQPGTHEDFGAIFDRLSSFATVVSVDRPGYGFSGAAPCSIAAQVTTIADLLASRGDGPALVVGHSFGGALALVLAAEHPELVAGIVLLGSVGGAGSIGALDRLLAFPAVGSVASWLALSAYGLFGPILARIGDRHELAANVPLSPRTGLTQSLTSFLVDQRALLDEWGLVDQAITQVACHALVIHGSLDTIVPLPGGLDLADRLRDSTLVVIDDVGHLIPRDAPDLVVSEIRAHFA